MYCRKCGYKLDSDAKACDECGTPVDGTEYCGGFWGLVNDEEKMTGNEKKQNCSEEEETYSEKECLIPERESTLSEQKNFSLRKVSVRKSNTFKILCFLLLIAAVQTFRVCSVSNRLDTRNQEYQNLLQSYERLLQKNNELMKQNNDLRDNENVEEPHANQYDTEEYNAEEYDADNNTFSAEEYDAEGY
ncbi:MAG: zinc-ribbon domain-containing protein [Lachnospiraceae bacterium]|nr:zinc-ribbon domain-containing protein [Lachnospiraceae bacterium]